MEDIKKLIDLAEDKLKFSYSKYSGIRVVAILLAKDGSIYYGVNIENASYGLTMCAERVAIFKAVSEGKTSFSKMLIYSPDIMPWPCGACRQVMSEFFSEDTEIIIVTRSGKGFEIRRVLFGELFPKKYQFTLVSDRDIDNKF